MAVSNETNVLFIPYRPSYSSKQPSVSGQGISQQKHAAREYHRKVKLNRLANKPSTTHKRKPYTELDINSAQSQRSPRSIAPSKNTFPIGEETDAPYRIFDVGAGQWDPFQVCIPRGVPNYVLQMLDHAISYQWPIFSSSKTQVSVGNIKNAVLKCAMSSPASFYAIVFAGATHNAFVHENGAIPKENITLRLAFKTQAIKALSEEINALQGDPSDELLLAIITLGVHGSGETLEPPQKPKKPLSPLATAQNFQYYGGMSWESAHIEAVRHMVGKKGGLHRLGMPGLANAIALGDIFLNFQKLAPPSYPLMFPTSFVMKTWPSPTPSAVRPLMKKLGTGFRDLPICITESPLFTIMDLLRDVTIGYDNYVRQVKPHPSLERVLWARNCLQHDLISLPEISQQDLKHDSCLHELCRLGTMAYTLIVLFPVPRVAGMHPRLAKRLIDTMDNCTILGMWDDYPGLLLWTTMLGGIIAETIPRLRRLYVSMSKWTPVKHTPGAWNLVRDICAGFLWYEEECDEAGKALWNDICLAIAD